MKATKLELQQNINRLTAELVELRAKLAESQANESFLRAKLEEADSRARRLIASRNHGNPQRRAVMEAAKKLAMETGTFVSTRDILGA